MESFYALATYDVPTAVANKDAGYAISSKNIHELPKSVQDAYKGYSNNGWNGNYKGQIQKGINEANAGSIYKNSDSKLPIGVTYKEFDINTTPIGAGRDAARLIRGSDGSVYYTIDHYTTFTNIQQGGKYGK